MDRYKTPEASRRLATVVLASGALGRPMIATPGIPPDRIKTLRDAFNATMKDPEFLAELDKRQFDLDPVAGDELERIVKEVMAQPPDTIARMKKTDVVVVGAGHNGLVCAAYLARGGLRTLLLEARDSVGGTAASERFAGATVNICNCDHLTFRATPISEELGLAAHGLRYLDVEPAQVNMSWEGGPAWRLFHGVEATLDEMAATYPGPGSRSEE